jgi:molybdopterin converting factor small subunit
MRIQLEAVGDLREYFGKALQEIELTDGASFGDLQALIGSRWGDKLPGYMWDAEKQQFRGAVFFVLDKHVVQDLDTPLEDGGEVMLVRAISGG